MLACAKVSREQRSPVLKMFPENEVPLCAKVSREQRSPASKGFPCGLLLGKLFLMNSGMNQSSVWSLGVPLP